MGKGDGGGKGPPKNPSAGRITRVLGKSITITADDDDLDPFGEGPAHHADAIQKEKGLFTYGGGGYRGKQADLKYAFVDMAEDQEADERDDWDSKFGGDTDLRAGRKKKSKKDKKRKKESADSDSDSDSSDDKKSKKKHKKKHKKHKKERAHQHTVLPSSRADDALVALLRSGCSSAEETKQLFTMLDGRQVVLTGGVQDKQTKKLLEAFLEALGVCTKIKSTQGTAFEPKPDEVLGIKLVRHYSHVLEKYARNPVSRKKVEKVEEAAAQVASVPSPKAAAAAKLSEQPQEEDKKEDEEHQEDLMVKIGPTCGPQIGPGMPEAEEAAPVVHVGPMMPGDFTRDELAKLADERAEAGQRNEPGPQRAGQYTMQQLQSFEVARTLEAEALEMTGRDDWMLTLPAEGKTRAELGAGDLTELATTVARGFNTKTGPVKEEGSRDKWVETPADRERKKLAALAGVVMHHTPSDQIAVVQQESAIQPYGTSYSRTGKGQSSKTLLEQHQAKEEKRKKAEKKKKKLPAAKAEYQPFDRERDLQIQSKPKLHDLKKLKAQFGCGFASSGYQA